MHKQYFYRVPLHFCFKETPCKPFTRKYYSLRLLFCKTYTYTCITISSRTFSERTGLALRKQLIQAYFKLGPRFIQKNGTGRLVTLSIEGIEQLKTYIELTIPRMIRSCIVPAILVVYVFTLDVTSAVILVVTIPIVIVFMILLGLAAQKWPISNMTPTVCYLIISLTR